MTTTHSLANRMVSSQARDLRQAKPAPVVSAPLVLSLLVLQISWGAPRVEALAERPRVEGVAKDLHFDGVRLHTALATISELAGSDVSAAKPFSNQRVCIHASSLSFNSLLGGIEKLFEVTPDAHAIWVQPEGRGWRLEDTVRRRNAVNALTSADLVEFRQRLAFLEEETKVYEKVLVDKPGCFGAELAVAQYRAHNLLLKNLGDAGIERLLSGIPVVVEVGRLSGNAKEIFRDLLRHSSPSLKDTPDETLDGHALVYLFARDPVNGRGHCLYESVVTPQGGTGIRRSILHMPRPYVRASAYPPFELPPLMRGMPREG